MNDVEREKIPVTHNGVIIGYGYMVDDPEGKYDFEMTITDKLFGEKLELPGMTYSIAGKDLGVKDEQS